MTSQVDVDCRGETNRKVCCLNRLQGWHLIHVSIL